MKKYKLIKDFPENIIDIGTIVTKDTLGQYVTTNITIFSKEEIENYPEFWEEIIEKDYEILSFKNILTGMILKKDSQLKDTFCFMDGISPFFKLEELLSTIRVHIHSVKRLNDNEIFTVGDTISGDSYKEREIIKFLIKNDKLVVEQIGGWGTRTGVSQLDCIKHAPKPVLFKTEDGVDVFEGMEVFVVHPTTLNTIIGLNTIEYSSYKGWLFFSTKDKMEEYVLMNKPCLSIKDICPVIGRCNYTTYIDLNKLTEKLKELVKTK
jgi:hypothetical protein